MPDFESRFRQPPAVAEAPKIDFESRFEQRFQPAPPGYTPETALNRMPPGLKQNIRQDVQYAQKDPEALQRKFEEYGVEGRSIPKRGKDLWEDLAAAGAYVPPERRMGISREDLEKLRQFADEKLSYYVVRPKDSQLWYRMDPEGTPEGSGFFGGAEEFLNDIRDYAPAAADAGIFGLAATATGGMGPLASAAITGAASGAGDFALSTQQGGVRPEIAAPQAAKHALVAGALHGGFRGLDSALARAPKAPRMAEDVLPATRKTPLEPYRWKDKPQVGAEDRALVEGFEKLEAREGTGVHGKFTSSTPDPAKPQYTQEHLEKLAGMPRRRAAEVPADAPATNSLMRTEDVVETLKDWKPGEKATFRVINNGQEEIIRDAVPVPEHIGSVWEKHNLRRYRRAEDVGTGEEGIRSFHQDAVLEIRIETPQGVKRFQAIEPKAEARPNVSRDNEDLDAVMGPSARPGPEKPQEATRRPLPSDEPEVSQAARKSKEDPLMALGSHEFKPQRTTNITDQELAAALKKQGAGPLRPDVAQIPRSLPYRMGAGVRSWAREPGYRAGAALTSLGTAGERTQPLSFSERLSRYGQRLAAGRLGGSVAGVPGWIAGRMGMAAAQRKGLVPRTTAIPGQVFRGLGGGKISRALGQKLMNASTRRTALKELMTQAGTSDEAKALIRKMLQSGELESGKIPAELLLLLLLEEED